MIHRPGAKPGFFKLWFLAIRPQTLPASVSPVAVGFALAYADGYREHLIEALVFWLFALFIQIGTNLHNDYADFVKVCDEFQVKRCRDHYTCADGG